MANLPADLPENWTSGQIISPNGTEVGLDAKHGYNYLMKQVNAAQTGVNTLNDDMTGVAQESTLQGVKTDVEALGISAAKETTLQTVKTNVAQVQTDVSDLIQNVSDLTPIWQHTDTTVDTVANRVGTTSDTGTTTVMGKLNKVMEGTKGNLTNGQIVKARSNVVTQSFLADDLPSGQSIVINITGAGEIYTIEFLYVKSATWKLIADGNEIVNCTVNTNNGNSVASKLCFGGERGQANGISSCTWALFQNGNSISSYQVCFVPSFVPQFHNSLQLICVDKGTATGDSVKTTISYGVITN